VTETTTVSVSVGRGGGGDDMPRTPNLAPAVLTKVDAKPTQATDGSVITESKNLLYVQPVVRHEPLPTESLVYIEPVIVASQDEAALLRANLDQASAPEAGSPLFDAFGLSAPRTEFVSPVQRASQANVQAETHTPVDTQIAVSDKAVAPAGPRPIEDHQPQPAPRRGAPSFSSQLRRDSEVMRTAGVRSMPAAQRAAAPKP
jgi:hypothetical protein